MMSECVWETVETIDWSTVCFRRLFIKFQKTVKNTELHLYKKSGNNIHWFQNVSQHHSVSVLSCKVLANICKHITFTWNTPKCILNGNVICYNWQAMHYQLLKTLQLALNKIKVYYLVKSLINMFIVLIIKFCLDMTR